MKASQPDLDRPTSRGAFILAIVAMVFIKTFLPFGRLLLYPLTLMATWVHEMGHGLSALLVGGSFSSLQIFGDASGLAFTATVPGWPTAMGAAGGLVAPPVVGALILALARGPRRSRIVLSVFALAIIVSLAIWVRTVVGWIAMPLVALVVAGIAWFGGPRERMVAAQFLGLTLAIDTVTRIDYLFVANAEVGGERRASDVARVASSIGGPYLAWGALIAAFSCVCIALGLWAAWWHRRDPEPVRPAKRRR